MHYLIKIVSAKTALSCKHVFYYCNESIKAVNITYILEDV